MPAMSSANFDFSRMEKGVNSVLGINTLNSLLADDDDEAVPDHSVNALADSVKHLHMETNGDGFPLLRRRDTDVDRDDRQTSRLSNIHRHRPGQQSLPWNTLRRSQHEEMDDSVFASPNRKTSANNRRSMEVYSGALGMQSKRSSIQSVTNGYGSSVPKLQQSYSTNDIPTIKNVNLHDGNTAAGANMTHAEQHLHNHNASLGRVPPSASNRQSRDFSVFDTRLDDAPAFSVSTGLQANAPSFQSPAAQLSSPSAPSSFSNNPAPSHASQNGFYSNYNMPMVNMGVNANGYGNNHGAWGTNGYAAQYQNYNGYGNGYGRPHYQQPDSQRAVMKNRKGEDGKFATDCGLNAAYILIDSTRFAHYNLESLVGQLYDLCKDQHGCRYLQRKIEEGNEAHIEMIFKETKEYIVELMTGEWLYGLDAANSDRSRSVRQLSLSEAP